MKSYFKKHRGHTLIELMVVMTIVSIIAVVAIPLFGSYQDQTKIDELKAVLLRAAAAQEKHFSANGTYAASASLLQKYGFPVLKEDSTSVLADNEHINLFTGVIIKEGIGMTFWVNGNLDLGKADKSCWLFVGSVLGTGGESNFLEIKPGDSKPYTGINCD